jgi:hypothetical protein
MKISSFILTFSKSLSSKTCVCIPREYLTFSGRARPHFE